MILNRVLMRAEPEFFSWDIEKQIEFKLHFLEDDKNREIFDRIIGKELFGVEVNDELKDNFTQNDWSAYNAMATRLTGFGDNAIVVNEFFTHENPIETFTTVYDYDKAYELEQYELIREDAEENLNTELAEQYSNKSYEFRLSSIWLRLIENEHFVYGTICSVRLYIEELVTDAACDVVDTYYPRTVTSTPTKNGSEIHMNYPDGKKEFTRELLSKVYREVPQLTDHAISKFFSEVGIGVFVLNTTHDCDDSQNTEYLFSCEEAAKHVKWRTFIKDINTLKLDNKPLDTLVEQLKEKAVAFVHEAYQDIEENFEPANVTPIKETKIILSEQVTNMFTPKDD
ncbi:hypothetical protein AB4254_08150 [Vibrio breoganii]